MSKLLLTWQAIHDQRTCKKCLALDGYTWVFEVGVNAFPTELTHPDYGVVWNVALGSDAHGRHNNSCRCALKPKFELADLLEKITKLYEDIVVENPEALMP